MYVHKSKGFHKENMKYRYSLLVDGVHPTLQLAELWKKHMYKVMISNEQKLNTILNGWAIFRNTCMYVCKYCSGQLLWLSFYLLLSPFIAHILNFVGTKCFVPGVNIMK